MGTWCLEGQVYTVVEAEGPVYHTTLLIPLDTRMIPGGDWARYIREGSSFCFCLSESEEIKNVCLVHRISTGKTAWDNQYMLVLSY